MNVDAETRRPHIGISIGDFNGIGPEVILKALGNQHLQKLCVPVLYGSIKIVTRYRKILNLKDWPLHQCSNVGQLNPKKVNLVNIGQNLKFDIKVGQATSESARFAVDSLKAATRDLKKGFLDAVVTGPISKVALQKEGFNFPGHTEFFTKVFEMPDSLMLMVSEDLRIAVVTGHIPLGEVSKVLTRERVMNKAKILLHTLQQDFGIQKPKVAVLGLNPHAGENGMLGDEEEQIIRPVTLELKKKGNLIYGPFPADGFFGLREYRKFDAVLAMYHDQGLIPFKTLAFEKGVNYTAGLPIVRTSPDHGTAFDIAGKNQADETSFLEALYLAHDIVRYRKENAKALEETQTLAKESN